MKHILRKSFTLIELVVVIIILGILATLGIVHLARVIERSKGAEAKIIIEQIRSTASAYLLEKGTLNGFNDEWAGIGTAADKIPSDCKPTHYFRYSINDSQTAGDEIRIEALRCTSGGKGFGALKEHYLYLTTNFTSGADDWESDINY